MTSLTIRYTPPPVLLRHMNRLSWLGAVLVLVLLGLFGWLVSASVQQAGRLHRAEHAAFLQRMDCEHLPQPDARRSCLRALRPLATSAPSPTRQ